MLRKLILLLAAVLVFGCSTQKEADKTEEVGMKNTKVLFSTSLGDFEVELYDNESPETVKNFLGYVKSRFYDGTVFHRVIPGFMAQGGGFTEDLEPKEGNAPIKNEASNGIKNERGTIAMARTNDPHSASSQFFINYTDNYFLDYAAETPQGWGYAVFGKVTKGMEIVDAMADVPTGSGGFFRSDVPQTSIVIKKVKMIKKK
ncbi:peptidyl-prolyl cis-trans isomerase [Geovibrio thiophilus]|uniref:Peptidyl-prolyl cis-trans isomerase n=1 Tax=Geovibrio thiophilus TaxID=139438 RepID=A0A410JWV3_9BACT|nr:peptidylprolyl isomerase [Geovibrio thiophilus]QAR32528.1 peptidyl-prolyl cis-trans isomerase [Geovibrio thiophilus]